MKYYSTNRTVPDVSLEEAVVKGLAPDNGLYMPEEIRPLSEDFFRNIGNISFQEIAFAVASNFFGDDIPASDLKKIVYSTLEFDCPLEKVDDDIYSLELFHGPTLAFKDVGARFMARLLQYFINKKGRNETVHVLVATSGDTGSAVANGFLGVDGIKVHVLYPKGKVSAIQECQFTTLGKNITALEVDGTFDDCQRLVKTAFLDKELNDKLLLTSANSINVARFLPQAFYYFNAYARLSEKGIKDGIVVSVPSGNFGNLTAGIIARMMGLPIKRFIAANNANDVVYQYLMTGDYTPRASVATIANAMDVGAPSNFARILDIFNNDHSSVTAMIAGATYSDSMIAETILDCYRKTGYVLDPHGACAYRALKENLLEGETGVFLETAHPAKFKQTVDSILGGDLEIPLKLQAFMQGEKKATPLSSDFTEFRNYLLALK